MKSLMNIMNSAGISAEWGIKIEVGWRGGSCYDVVTRLNRT